MDYNKSLKSFQHFIAHWHLVAISFGLVAIVTLTSWLWPTSHNAIGTAVHKRIALPRAAVEKPAPELKQGAGWQTVTVQSGDSFARLAPQLGLDAVDVAGIIDLGNKTQILKHLQPGQSLQIIRHHNRLQQLRFPTGTGKALLIRRSSDGWEAKQVSIPLESHVHYAFGTIHHSFVAAAHQAGLDKRLVHELIAILHHKINFSRIRRGDSFTVIYNDYYFHDRKVSSGHVLAAVFIHHGKTTRVLRFTNPATHVAHYYTPKGHSLEKSFLRVPLRYTHISSSFGLHRIHPILKVVRPHEGVDLAAPRGTPIKAVSDGVITYRKRYGGYGKTIVLKHSSRYSTLYAHMSRFTRHLHVGSHVKLGQVIGFVGSTGLATGPHVHFEFRIHKRHVNPMTVRLPDAQPVPHHFRKRFLAKTRPLLAELKLYRLAQLASQTVA